MFGRIRASASSLESLEGSPSKILKDDSFSIYEATLMKLKLGAQHDISPSSKEMVEIINDDSSISSSCVEEANMKSNCTLSSSPATPSSSHQIMTSPSDGIMVMVMDTDCSSITTSPSFSDHISAGNSEPRSHNNVSILHFFKFKDPGLTGVSSCAEPTSTRNDSSGSISSSSIEYHSRSEMERIQSLEDCELPE